MPASAPSSVKAVTQEIELAPSADQLGEASLRMHLQSGPPPAADEPKRGHGFRLAPDFDRTERFATDLSLDQTMGAHRGEDRSGLGEGLHPRGKVRGVTDCRVVHAKVVADLSNDDGARVQPDTDPELDAALSLKLLGQSADRLLDRERRFDGSERMVFERDRRAEQCHEPVAEELVDGAVIAVDRLCHQP